MNAGLNPLSSVNVRKVSIGEKEYPEALKQIFDPPKTLYYIGDLGILKKPMCAVVGTRRCSSYGESQGFRFGKELSRHGVCVVSGLAYGVDSAAHKGALEGASGAAASAGGGTVAVLAQGLPEIRPAANTSLARKIVENGGLLLSEKAAGTKSFASDYLIRNRIIAGLSKGTLVVEASYKSGALNTAAHALRENRAVMALPGRVTDEQSLGTNLLIKKGATPINSPEELAEELGFKWERAAVILTGVTKEIFEELKTTPQSPAELGEHFKGSLSDLYEALGELELRGLIRFTKELRYAVCAGSTGGAGGA